jgi:hypothetical protein
MHALGGGVSHLKVDELEIGRVLTLEIEAVSIWRLATVEREIADRNRVLKKSGGG